MGSITPKAGFDWNKVAWSKPDSVRAATCSHIECLALIPEDSVPLMMWKPDGACAQFCDGCSAKWWGIRSYGAQD